MMVGDEQFSLSTELGAHHNLARPAIEAPLGVVRLERQIHGRVLIFGRAAPTPDAQSLPLACRRLYGPLLSQSRNCFRVANGRRRPRYHPPGYTSAHQGQRSTKPHHQPKAEDERRLDRRLDRRCSRGLDSFRDCQGSQLALVRLQLGPRIGGHLDRGQATIQLMAESGDHDDSKDRDGQKCSNASNCVVDARSGSYTVFVNGIHYYRG